jgi:hypothetical protein
MILDRFGKPFFQPTFNRLRSVMNIWENPGCVIGEFKKFTYGPDGKLLNGKPVVFDKSIIIKIRRSITFEIEDSFYGEKKLISKLGEWEDLEVWKIEENVFLCKEIVEVGSLIDKIGTVVDCRVLDEFYEFTCRTVTDIPISSSCLR